MRTVTINGARQSVQAGTVAAVVKELELPAPLLLVEVNGVALHKNEWVITPVEEGDRIEILRIAAGG